MRLTPYQINAIKETAIGVFGPQVEVHLFGSRLDDTRRGGDIDLYLKGVTKSPSISEQKIQFLVQLKSRIGEQRIDLLLLTDKMDSNIPVIQSAEKYGIKL